MTETTENKVNYKKTLNLPKTAFPMRANLAQNEPQSQKRWQQMNLYEQVTEVRADAQPFVFHDGPPYASGPLHVGHLLNKCLKDMVVRSQMLAGRKCPFVPGWDCHGLPIEHKVMSQLNESGKLEKINQLDDDKRRMAIRRECQKTAEKFVKMQAEQMQRLLTLADYDHPYLTMTPDYERAVLEVFAELLEQGLVYRALKAVHWSVANETALADAELEYHEKEDLSVYVDFEAEDRDAVAKVFGIELDQTPSFMIWTTTPWTLPANLAVAVHNDFVYALVRIDGNITVLANDLVETVTQKAGSESVEVLATANGKNLIGLRYRHPFCDRSGAVVAADYVTLEDGTGLVHTAPGHGHEDYQTGVREGLDIYCPVNADGTFDETVPDWLQGRNIWEANDDIAEHLRDSGHLFHWHKFTHSYPHDWRSKTPVIFRATEQWFVGVDQPMKRENKTLRDMALNAAENEIQFVPHWGRNRMRGMLESRPDWCLSRQRAWGLPIPAFTMPDGDVFMTPGSVRAVADAFASRGSDAWFTESPATLLETYDAANDPDAPQWVKDNASKLKTENSQLKKAYDIFDVWFESGSSWHAVMRQRDLGFPVDLYLEGSDQHRGWFQLSLLPALGVTGQPPFRGLLTHGFMVDKDGRKMSKSMGNTLDVEDLLKNFGADVCRWWVSSLTFENDIKVDNEFFELAGESYRKVRNTLRFLLSNLQDFNPEDTSKCVARDAIQPTSIDGYVLQQAAKLQRAVMKAYDEYEFRRAHQYLYDFCNETLSAFYCYAVKDRLYCDKADSPRRRQTQTVMWELMQVLSRLIAPILPHTADEAYRTLMQQTKGEEDVCVHLLTPYPVAYQADADWEKVIAMRERALKALEDAKANGLENPLDAGLVVPDADGVLKKFEDDLADILGVSRLTFKDSGDIEVQGLRNEPRCERSWKRDGTVKQRADGGWLTDRDAEAVGVE